MKPGDGGRKWVKLWVSEWLDGTTRWQLTGVQRAFWMDLIAMAGRGRVGGVVCSGKDGDTLIGYPLQVFEALSRERFDVLETLALFERTGKIRMEISDDLYVVHILNWARYQSEYERTKKYRGKKSESATPNATENVHGKSHRKTRKSNTTEVEVEVEGDSEPDQNQKPGSAIALWAGQDFENPKIQDPRFQQITNVFFEEYGKRFGVAPDFDGSDGIALGRFLKRRNEPVETLIIWLKNAFESSNVPQRGSDSDSASGAAGPLSFQTGR